MTTYILNCLTHQKMIVFSWGFHKAIALKNGLRFSVNGFIHKGIVEVLYNEGEDLFEINLIKNGEIIKHIASVSIDELIETLDENIEKVENYNERVKKEYDL